MIRVMMHDPSWLGHGRTYSATPPTILTAGQASMDMKPSTTAYGSLQEFVALPPTSSRKL